MILIVDNYDSFTYNLVQLFAPFGLSTKVVRNDELTAEQAAAMGAEAIVLSPGPCTPHEAGICLDLARVAAERKMPLLGVCLGHQAIAETHGARVIRARQPMHGKVSMIRQLAADPFFAGLSESFPMTRYHSLTVAKDSVPAAIEVLAEAEDDGEIMALKVKGAPVYGVQFHPESYLSTDGSRLLGNFLKLAGLKAAA
jgi:anthranilate synthase component 2